MLSQSFIQGPKTAVSLPTAVYAIYPQGTTDGTIAIGERVRVRLYIRPITGCRSVRRYMVHAQCIGQIT